MTTKAILVRLEANLAKKTPSPNFYARRFPWSNRNPARSVTPGVVGDTTQ